MGGLPDAPPPPVVPVRVGGSVREPKRIVSVPPVYPKLAMRARLAGSVVVEATIDPHATERRPDAVIMTVTVHLG